MVVLGANIKGDPAPNIAPPVAWLYHFTLPTEQLAVSVTVPLPQISLTLAVTTVGGTNGVSTIISLIFK